MIIRFWIIAGLFIAVALGLFYADFLSIRSGATVTPPSPRTDPAAPMRSSSASG